MRSYNLAILLYLSFLFFSTSQVMSTVDRNSSHSEQYSIGIDSWAHRLIARRPRSQTYGLPLRDHFTRPSRTDLLFVYMYLRSICSLSAAHCPLILR